MRTQHAVHRTIWLALIFSLLHPCLLLSQTHKYWIFLNDKGLDAPALLNKIDAANPRDLSFLGLTERAIARRWKMHPDGNPIDLSDVPIHRPYLQVLSSIGIHPLRTSKWLNAVSAELSSDQAENVRRLPFVEEVRPVAVFLRKEPYDGPPAQLPTQLVPHHAHDYGPSLTQLDLIRIPELHDLGITGEGVLVGMLDTGFRWKTHEALMNIRVVSEYDFISGDSVTADEPQDSVRQDGHGTATLSLVGGFKEAKLIGGAFGADFLLARTEYVPTETKVEEDNWVAGMEWMESRGADVVNSSLGYFDFDPEGPGGPDYIFSDLDGKTAVTTRAANAAFSKGVIVCVSAGNNNRFSYWPYINMPADAFGALAVGAVSADGTIASFSSRGPTADGRVKPDIVAMGVSTRAAALTTTVSGDSSIYTFFSGTSASAPLATSAAALLLSARPELTPSQVFDALRNTADRATDPDNAYGWGLVNAVDALQYPTLTVDNVENRIELFLASPGGIAPGSPTLYFKREGESTFTAQPMELTRSFQSTTRGLYAADIPIRPQFTPIRFYVQLTDSVSGPTTIPVQAPLLTFAFNDGVGTLSPPVIIPAEFRLYQNFPNPFNQGTFIRYDLEEPRTVTLEVFNILGQRVATLVSGVFQAAGRYEVRLNDSNLASGVYFYTLQAGDLAQTRKMVLIR